MSKEKILIKLLGSTTRIKIMGYLFFNKKESYIRELSRELKISPSAVKRETDNLAEAGIVKKEKNNIILNDANSIVADLKNIFLKTDFAIYPLKDALISEKIQFAFIFGSFASGRFDENSDIDLMIIGDTSLDKIIKLIKIPEKEIGRDINPVVWTMKNFKKERKNGFVQDVLKKGIIMIKGDENELRKIAG